MERKDKGITFIETLIAVAAVSLLFVLAVPTYTDYLIRAKVAEGIASAAQAQSSLAEICAVTPHRIVRTNSNESVDFKPTRFVDQFTGYADCARGELTVGVITRDTGASNSPVVAIFGQYDSARGEVTWQCRTIIGDTNHVPADCREFGIPAGFASPVAHSG